MGSEWAGRELTLTSRSGWSGWCRRLCEPPGNDGDNVARWTWRAGERRALRYVHIYYTRLHRYSHQTPHPTTGGTPSGGWRLMRKYATGVVAARTATAT